ncbi:MAG: endonuclease/exonuclease/phosphatase family protein [Clostridia bacterium]|nr:endonuclease/exonuclease/phosphatase family protein [Clostridia bacterium]
MKILTYNLWNSSAGMPQRAVHICDTLLSCHADVLCLQEVPDAHTAEEIAEACSCPTVLYSEVSGCALLSRLSAEFSWHHRYAVGSLLHAEKKTILSISVHLPWNSTHDRETAISEIVQEAEKQDTDYIIFAGDFNCSDTSDVHRFLTGDCTIERKDAYYYDLALARQAVTETGCMPTLDFRRNPRWGVAEPVNTIEIPQRVDRIYLKNPYPAPLPVLQDCGIFGTEPDRVTGLCPSDHYGVYAVLQIPD